MCNEPVAQTAEARLTEELADCKRHIASVEAECEALREQLHVAKRRVLKLAAA